MASERKNAIITGSASGLGRAMAVRLAREGWNIAVCDRNEAAGEETVELVRKAGGDGGFHRIDVASIDDWSRLSDELRARWTNLDLLANNAGVAGAGNVGEFSLDDWRWVLDVNLWNGIHGCHTFVDWLKANPKGAHIINTASMAAIVSAPGMAAYNVSKAAMLSLSETLYGELKPHGVGVTVICPSFFATNLLKEGRFLTPEHKNFAEAMFRVAKFNADDVAELAIRCMKKKQLYALIPFEAKVNWWYKRLMPGRYLNHVAEQFARQLRRSPEKATVE